MIILKGSTTSGGIAIGPLYIYGDVSFSKDDTVNITDVDPNHEIQRFEGAKKAVSEEYNRLYEKTKETSGEDVAMIFQIHGLMLEDDDFSGFIINQIKEKKVSAESAVLLAEEHLEKMLLESGDENITERNTDVREIGGLLLENLGGRNKKAAVLRPSVIFASELTPLDTVRMDRSKILAFLTEKGTRNAHSAILARSMGIPAISSLENFSVEKYRDKQVIVDGNTGSVYIDPDEETLQRFKSVRILELKRDDELKRLIGRENETVDGKKIEVFANIGNQSDVEAVLKNDAGGIGLFRSEFLYLGCSAYPDEETLFAAYKTVARCMDGRQVIIRTIDIGADKNVPYFDLPIEENPAMGFRAVRICLAHPEIFKTQLKAILRASAFGKVSVMFPMIVSVEELRLAKKILAEAKKELEDKKIDFDSNIKVGIMIETPAAAIMSDVLASECDFFSIGTNDLTQYTLAADRQNPAMANILSGRQPSVMRLIKHTVENAHKAGIKVGICGELASDLSLTEEFLRLDVDELSVSVGSILPLRQKIRSIDLRL